MTTITVTQDNKTLTITQPDDIPLTETDDSYYSWKHVFAVILHFLTFPPDTINSVMPDCEECDVVEELNREHNAELSAQCERCEYKRDSVNEGVKRCYTCQRDGESEECYTCTPDYINWKPKKSVQDNVQEIMEVTMDDNMEVNEEKTCDNCEYEYLEETDHPCKECVEDDDTVYGKWQPKKEPPIITEEVEKETVKNCHTCNGGDDLDRCGICRCYSHWQPVSANDETTGKSEI